MENIINLNEWKEKKQTTEDLTRDRTPLYVSHIEGKLYGTPNKGNKKTELDGDLGTRLARINASLAKIDRLMSELKKVSTNGHDNDSELINLHKDD